MKTIAAQLMQARAALAPVAGDNAALEARVLAAHAWGMTPEVLVRDADTVRESVPFMQLVERRLAYEPVSHIVGTKEFWKDEFLVTRNVLTPRADSETMIEELLRARPDRSAALRILDLGTGSGCLLLSALREYPQAMGFGADQSTDALDVASQNAERLQLTTRSRFMQSNWCASVPGTFDVVLSNPPYIPTGDIATLDTDVRDYEPRAALDGGADGLECYRTIIEQLRGHLNPGALVLFEVGMGQADGVAQLGKAAGFAVRSITKDLAGIARIVALENQLMEDGDRHDA